MRVLHLFVFFTLWCCESPGQAPAQALPAFSKDSAGVETLMHLVGELYATDPVAATRYCLEARQVSAHIGYPKGELAASGWLAFLYEQQGKIDEALASYRYSLQLAEIEKDRQSQSQILNNLAAIYKDLGKIDSALAYYEQSIAIKRAIGDVKGLAAPLNNIGLIYFNQGQIQKALDYYNQSLKAEETAGNQGGIAISLHNIGSVFVDVGLYEEALNYAERSMRIQETLQNKYELAYSLNFLGTIYEKQGRWREAGVYFSRSLQLREEIADEQGIAYSLRNLASLYEKTDSAAATIQNYYARSRAIFERLGDKWGVASVSALQAESCIETGDYNEAKALALRSLTLAQELGFPKDIYKAARTLSRIYRQEKNWPEAVRMDDLFVRMNDSIQNEQTRKESLRTMLRYEYEKKENAFKNEQEKQKLLADEAAAKAAIVRNFLLLGFGSVVLFLLVVFRQRNRLAREKRKSDALLLNILPAETAEELKSTGAARAKRYDCVTVLFTDFKDFTQTSAAFDAEEIVREINACYTAFDRIVTKFGLEKIKTIGDSYMCAGGLPVPNQTNPVDAVQAALAIRAFMTKRGEERARNSQLFFEVRIGIHTGPVVAGVVGEKKFAYDIWGDTVNTAARLEQSSLPGQINISGATYMTVKDHFTCLHRGKVEARHKGELEMYFVEGERVD